MSEATIVVERLLLGAAMALLLLGATSCWLAVNAIKRLAGILVAGLGALAALAVLQTPAVALIAGAAVLFGYLAVGVALTVRLQESYGAIETLDIDAADAADEPPDRAT